MYLFVIKSKLGIAAHTYHISAWETEAIKSGVQGHPQFLEFKAQAGPCGGPVSEKKERKKKIQ